MTRFARKIAMVLTTVLVLAACGGGSDDGAADTVGTTVTEAPATTAAPAATTIADQAPSGGQITSQDFDFGTPITVGAGATIEVTNADGVAHTWTSTDGLFDSGNLDGGDSFSFTFEEAGVYNFVCSIHPSMTGSVTVGS